MRLVCVLSKCVCLGGRRDVGVRGGEEVAREGNGWGGKRVVSFFCSSGWVENRGT